MDAECKRNDAQNVWNFKFFLDVSDKLVLECHAYCKGLQETIATQTYTYDSDLFKTTTRPRMIESLSLGSDEVTSISLGIVHKVTYF